MATYYFRNTGNTNYNVGTNWSTTSGGGSAGVVPNATSDIIIDSNSGNLNVNVGSLAKSLTVTATKTITLTNILTVSGNVTMFSGMTWAGANNLNINSNSTITSNGVYFPNTLGLNNTSTVFTLVGDLYVNNVTFDANSKTINGNDLYTNGGITTPGNTGSIKGTSTIYLIGTGSIVSIGGSYFGINITINTSGTITIGDINYGIGILKYIAGTVNNTGTVNIVQGGCTLDTVGMSFNNISTLGFINPIYLPTRLTINGYFSPSTNIVNITGSGGFTCNTLQMGTGTLTLPVGVNFTVTNSMNSLIATLAVKALINSSTPGVQAILILSPGATQDNGYLSATDIDSSGGVSIWTYKGILTNTTNWNNLSTDPRKHVFRYSLGNKIMK